MTEAGERLVRQHRRRIAALVGLIAVVALLAAAEPVHSAIRSLIDSAEPLIHRHAVAGAVVFVLLAALSAMVVFFSTAVLTPIAVDAFGPVAALLLLWLGWFLGGLTAFGIGRIFGHQVVRWFVDPQRLEAYEHRASQLVLFRHVLLFQLAVPSEVPGYVLGLAGCRFRTFAAAMALGELPFAIGAVYLGESFLERNYVLLLVVGLGGVALSWIAFRRAQAIWGSDSGPGDAAPVSLVVDDGGGGDRRDEQPHVLTHAEPERGV